MSHNLTQFLDALEAKTKAATPGRWYVDRDYDVVTDGATKNGPKRLIAGSMSLYPMENDAAYIAALDPETISALIEVARALERILRSEVVRQAPFAGYSEALSDAQDALARLEARLGGK